MKKEFKLANTDSGLLSLTTKKYKKHISLQSLKKECSSKCLNCNCAKGALYE